MKRRFERNPCSEVSRAMEAPAGGTFSAPTLAGVLAAAIVWLSLAQCAPVAKTAIGPESRAGEVGTAAKGAVDIRLSPAQQYAGEVLAYMMLTVLGDAGQPDMREAWRTRGMDAELDLSSIADTMLNPGKDKSTLMVMDANILGLSEVLFHYDKRLNLFKGKKIFNSIYPSQELIALRLLLVQKRGRGEKIRLKPIMDRGLHGLDTVMAMNPADASEANLDSGEMRLLQAAFESETVLMRYLVHPFLLSTLYSAGCIESDNWVRAAEKRTHYRLYRNAGCAFGPTTHPGAVKIALLPSLISNFQSRSDPEGQLMPDEAYRKTTGKFRDKILAAVEHRMKTAYPEMDRPSPRTGTVSRKSVWRDFVRENLMIIDRWPRPFVIHPDNADERIRDLCPDADFSVIILGKNVYRSIYFDEKKDVYPAVNRLYLDFLDIRYSQVSDEIDQISRFVVDRLKELGTI